MVILDTSILIDHLRRSKREQSYFEQMVKSSPNETFATSMISVQELYQDRSTREKDQEIYVLSILARLKILPYTYDVAQTAGEIARDISRPIEFVDVAIAATSIINDCQLATLNKKDFQGIKGLEFVKLS